MLETSAIKLDSMELLLQQKPTILEIYLEKIK